ncbi:MAG: hypothetical protein HC778_01365 [Chamaesiphon sp. CSU_1_12]|nr:hypothetical protein [Chamaesiphon sp. CSU_1_12]
MSPSQNQKQQQQQRPAVAVDACVDVEADAEKSDQMRNILHSQHIFIPERYHVKMIHNGLMARFVQFIKQESKLIKQSKS